jgi:hypothetical protein
MVELKRVYAKVDEAAALSEPDRYMELWGKKYPETAQPGSQLVGAARIIKYLAKVRKNI